MTDKINADLILKNCGQILTCKKDSKDLVDKINDGWIAIKNDKIIELGSKSYVERKINYDKADIIDVDNKVVSPGFIDAHTHVVFGGSRVEEYSAKIVEDSLKVENNEDIETGIMATVKMTRNISADELFNVSSKRIKNMLKHGITTIESKSGYGLNKTSEIKILKVNKELNKKLPVDIVSTFLGAHGWPENITKEKYINILISEMIPWVAELELAEYCDIWCDDGHYNKEDSKKILLKAQKMGLKPKIHTGAYSYIGGGDLAAEMKMVSADHLNYTPLKTIKKLANSEVTGVLLPGTDFTVNHPHPVNPKPMIKAGMNLALATNCNPGTWIESMQFILALACKRHNMSPSEAIRAGTIGGAMALNLEDDRGSLEKGKRADIQIWDTTNYKDIIYKYGRNLVNKVIKNGKIIVEN